MQPEKLKVDFKGQNPQKHYHEFASFFFHF